MPRALLVTFGATDRFTDEGKANEHLIAGQVEIDIFNGPRRIETEKTAVVLVEIVHSKRIRNPRRRRDEPLESAKNPSLFAPKLQVSVSSRAHRPYDGQLDTCRTCNDVFEK